MNLSDHLVLVVEDSESLSALYRAYLEDQAWQTVFASSAAIARQIMSSCKIVLILLDLQLPDADGLELLENLREQYPQSAVVVVTGHGSIDLAVAATRLGALDFLEKPVTRTRLVQTVRNALERLALQNVVARWSRDRFHDFIGASLVMQGVYRTIEAAAHSRATVMITGESGTGKEVCAQALHAESPRRQKPWVALNCAAIPRDLLESELFGHVRGAFTGASQARVGAAELAHGGTLFLDEIGEMPMELQSKLLRFLQTGSVQPVGSSQIRDVDVRIVAATNRDPWAEVQAGRFREDLYYRLNVIPIELPPLREREGDVRLLARELLARSSQEEGREFEGFEADAEQLLSTYQWPGNVRELANTLRQIVVLHPGPRVRMEYFPRRIRQGGLPTFQPELPIAKTEVVSRPMAVRQTVVPLRLLEAEAIQGALEYCNGNVPRAAALLEVNPSTIYRSLQRQKAAE